MNTLLILFASAVFGFIVGLQMPRKQRTAKKRHGLRKKGKSKTTYPGYTSYTYH